MALHYRGVTYDRTPASIETPESEVVGHYRGATWKIRQPVQTSAQRSEQHLKYRGAWVR